MISPGRVGPWRSGWKRAAAIIAIGVFTSDIRGAPYWGNGVVEPTNEETSGTTTISGVCGWRPGWCPPRGSSRDTDQPGYAAPLGVGPVTRRDSSVDPAGSVANFGSRCMGSWRPMMSGGDSKQAGNEGGLRRHVPTGDVTNLRLSDHRHRLVASKCPSGRLQAPEAEPRSCPSTWCNRVAEAAMDQAASVVSWAGAALMVVPMSSAIGSVCM